MSRYTKNQLIEMSGLSFYSEDIHKEISIKDYLKELLKKLWEEKESFSSKRPLGNSGWYYDLAVPLIKNGFVDGTLDKDGYILSVDEGVLQIAVNEIIEFIFE